MLTLIGGRRIIGLDIICPLRNAAETVILASELADVAAHVAPALGATGNAMLALTGISSETREATAYAASVLGTSMISGLTLTE